VTTGDLPVVMAPPMGPSTFTRRIAGGVFAVTAFASTATAQITVGSGLRIDQPARSMKDLRDRNVIKQRFDFSCGAAALATLLRYGFGQSITEAQIMVALFDLPTEDEKAARRRTGFSLLDMQRVARAQGYEAEGFRLEPDQLSMLGGPVIVYIEPRGYKHFAVLRGIRGDRVYLADPSLGNVRMPLYAFLDRWLQDDNKGIIFVVEPKSGASATVDALTRTLPANDHMRPEIIAAREMMSVRAPLVRSSR
jgi:uncharacterized protein